MRLGINFYHVETLWNPQMTGEKSVSERWMCVYQICLIHDQFSVYIQHSCSTRFFFRMPNEQDIMENASTNNKLSSICQFASQLNASCIWRYQTIKILLSSGWACGATRILLVERMKTWNEWIFRCLQQITVDVIRFCCLKPWNKIDLLTEIYSRFRPNPNGYWSYNKKIALSTQLDESYVLFVLCLMDYSNMQSNSPHERKNAGFWNFKSRHVSVMYVYVDIWIQSKSLLPSYCIAVKKKIKNNISPYKMLAHQIFL